MGGVIRWNGSLGGNATPADWECFCSDLSADEYSSLFAAFNFTLIILLMPLVSLMGMWSNVCNLFVYTRRSMRSSANVYLAALGTSDFFVVLTGMFIFWIDSARSYIPSLKLAPYSIVYTLPIGYIAQTCSVYFTVFAAVDCYVAVCCHGLHSAWCTVKRAKHVVYAVVAGSTAYNSLRFGQFKLHHCLPPGDSEVMVEICPTPLFMSINTVYNVYMYMVLMTFLPFILLSLLNALILNRVKRKAAPPPPVGSNAASSSVEGDGDATTMIMVVVMFLACNTLALVVNVVETFFPPSKLVLNYMTDTSNFLVIFNSSANFIVYIIFSPQFRRIFLARPCLCFSAACMKRRKKRGSLLRRSRNGYDAVPADVHRCPSPGAFPPPSSAHQAGRLALRGSSEQPFARPIADDGRLSASWTQLPPLPTFQADSGFDPRNVHGIFV